MKQSWLKNNGYVILLKPRGARKWRIGYEALFSSRKSAEQFAAEHEMGGETKIATGSITASLLY